MQMHLRLTFIAVALFLLPDLLIAQEAEKHVIPRVEGTINFDGRTDDPAWENLTPLKLNSHWPEFGNDAVKETDFRVAYDDKYFYLIARCYEDRKNIQESSFKRDSNWELKFDHIALVLDTYNDAENGVMFIVSPSGARTDQTIRNDAISGQFFNGSWNSFWDAEVSYFDGGWQTEIRIPFDILRFDTKDGRTEMGLIAYRYSAHDKILDIYPKVSNEFGFFSFAKPSLSQDVVFENIQNKRPVYFTPFVLGSMSRENVMNAEETGYETIEKEDFSTGFGVQYALSNSLNADISFNTDFAQVEADNQQVNLTRFSLFFPEKRRFFQERSSTFEFNNDGNNKLFYSRKIGLKSGGILPLWGGARLVGRSGKIDFGVLTMQSKKTSDFSSENYGVARFRSDILNENSYLGGMLTTVTGKDGQYNLGYGLDGLFNLFGEEYLKVSLAQTASDGPTDGSALDNSRIFIEWEKRKNVGFGYKLNFGHVGDTYNPELGFENRANYWRLGDRVFYNIWVLGESPIQRIDLSMNTNVFVSRATDKVESATLSPRLSIAGKNEFTFDLSLTSFYDSPQDTFSISSDVEVVPDDYWNHSANISYTTPRINLYTFTFGYQFGGFYDGTIHSPSIAYGYLPSKYLQLDLSAEYNNIQIKEFDTFESFVSRINITALFDVRWTVSSFVQFNSTTDLWVINSRLRYNPRDGINLYLVYNSNLNSDVNREIPRLPNNASSTIVLKYSHTLFL